MKSPKIITQLLNNNRRVFSNFYSKKIIDIESSDTSSESSESSSEMSEMYDVDDHYFPIISACALIISFMSLVFTLINHIEMIDNYAVLTDLCSHSSDLSGLMP
ncbi:MAG: hypothetical protein N2B06_16930 [Clostridium sp.]